MKTTLKAKADINLGGGVTIEAGTKVATIETHHDGVSLDYVSDMLRHGRFVADTPAPGRLWAAERALGFLEALLAG